MSVAFGLAYPLIRDHLPAPAMAIAVKGAGVGLLAIVAALQARSHDVRLLAYVMALGGYGRRALEIAFAAGAVAFAAGHVVAILLYRRNCRSEADQKDMTIAALILLAAAVMPPLLLQGRAEAVPFTAYALLLGAMAASGAAGLDVPIWLLYYVGQLMIFLGVISSIGDGEGDQAEPGGGVAAQALGSPPPDPLTSVPTTSPPQFVWSVPI